jgi:hypothetical protein
VWRQEEVVVGVLVEVVEAEVVEEEELLVGRDNLPVTQQEALLGEELEITPPPKWTLCCRPFGLFARLAMTTGK